MFWSVGWPLLWAGGFFCNLDILYGGLGIGKLQFLIKKKFTFFFQLLFFFNFWPLKPWIRIGSGSGSVSGSVLASIRILWIRIRIRKKWIRIRNPAFNLMRIRIRILPLTFFQIWTLQCSKKTLKGFHLLTLMRMLIMLFTLMRNRIQLPKNDADPLYIILQIVSQKSIWLQKKGKIWSWFNSFKKVSKRLT